MQAVSPIVPLLVRTRIHCPNQIDTILESEEDDWEDEGDWKLVHRSTTARQTEDSYTGAYEHMNKPRNLKKPLSCSTFSDPTMSAGKTLYFAFSRIGAGHLGWKTPS